MSEETNKLCECGCGQVVTPGSRFISGHNTKGKHPTKEKIERELKTKKINQEIREGTRPAPEPTLCECGCGELCKIGNRYICGHNGRGKHHTEEHKKELSEMNTGENHPMYGTHPSKETRKKMSDSHIGIPNNCLGKKYSDEHRLHLSESHMGNPGYWLGKHRSEETIKKISKKSSGENNGNWKGGIACLPYCEKFDENLKERVREFFGRECVLCGIPENGRKLCVHHVNYNKDTCCDNSKPLFVSLCRNCHSKTNGNRKYYEALFTKLIMEEYNGECYLPKNG